MKTREKYSALGFADKKRKIYAPVACIVSSVQLGNSASDLLLFLYGTSAVGLRN